MISPLNINYPERIPYMKGFKCNIEKTTLENDNFRKVLYSGHYLQLVLMSLKVGEEIGAEIHPDTDQFFRFEGGSGKCIIDGNEYKIKDGDVIVVPAGAKHNVINVDSTKKLKMYTIYAPPHHKDGIVRATKKDAVSKEAEFDGKATE
jgi:mannose-6-phosphate isomerase-like protein (cupin superfamily)